MAPYAFAEPGDGEKHEEHEKHEKHEGHEGTKGTKRVKPAAPKRRRARIVAKAGRKAQVVAKAGALTVTEVAELEDLRKQLRRTAGGQSPLRWNADPDEVRRSVAQLVLTLVEFVRKLLERQSIRRMEAGTLTDRQVEDVGRALMQLEETVRDIATSSASRRKT